ANLAAVCTGGGTDHHARPGPQGPWGLGSNPNQPDGLRPTPRNPNAARAGPRAPRSARQPRQPRGAAQRSGPNARWRPARGGEAVLVRELTGAEGLLVPTRATRVGSHRGAGAADVARGFRLREVGWRGAADCVAPVVLGHVEMVEHDLGAHPARRDRHRRRAV